MEENQQQVVPPQQAPPVVEPVVSPADVLTPQETPKKGNKAIWFLGLLTALVLLVVAYLAYQNNQLKKELKVVKLNNATVETQVSISPTEAITPTPDPTAGWEIYKNDDWGYQFKYPSAELKACDYSITESGLQLWRMPWDCQPTNSEWYELSVLGLSIDDYTVTDVPLNTETVTIGGLRATKNIYLIGDENVRLQSLGKETEYVVKRDDGILQIVFFGEDTERQTLFDQILSTFEFTE